MYVYKYTNSIYLNLNTEIRLLIVLKTAKI
jgi:hypothetical protein